MTHPDDLKSSPDDPSLKLHLPKDLLNLLRSSAITHKVSPSKMARMILSDWLRELQGDTKAKKEIVQAAPKHEGEDTPYTMFCRGLSVSYIATRLNMPYKQVSSAIAQGRINHE